MFDDLLEGLMELPDAAIETSHERPHYTVRADGTVMLPVGVRPPTFPSEDDPDDIEHLTKTARERASALRAA